MEQATLKPQWKTPVSPFPASAVQPTSQRSNIPLLSSIRPIEKQDEARKPEVHENKTVRRLLARFLEFNEHAHKYKEISNINFAYKQTLKSLRGFYCTNADINELLFLLKLHEDLKDFYYTGFFISALVELSFEKEFTLKFSHFDNTMSYVCFENTKHVIINGNVGSASFKDNRGTIILNGNARSDCGDSNFGTIVLNGSATDNFCSDNYGSVTVNGDAGVSAAFSNNGSFTLNGNARGFKKSSGEYAFGTCNAGTLILNGDAPYGIGAAYSGRIFINGRIDELEVSSGHGKPSEIIRAIRRSYPCAQVFHNGRLVLDGLASGWKLRLIHPILALQGKTGEVQTWAKKE